MSWTYWLRDKDSEIPTWSPYDPDTGQVVLGLMVAADGPPFDGTDAGTFWHDDDGLLVEVTL